MKATGIVTPQEVMSKEEYLIEKITVDAEFDYKMDQLTEAERAEYDRWSESVNAETPLPLQCKCGKIHSDHSHPEGDYDLCLDCQPEPHYEPHMPFDEKWGSGWQSRQRS